MNSFLMSFGVAGLSLLSLSANSHAAAKCCNTPTVWTFKNIAKLPVRLTCSLDSSPAAPVAPVTLSTDSIAPGGSFDHNWGPNWDNDGMGLIPGQWTCRNVETKGRLASSTTVKFSTDWGENVIVTWKDSEPTVAKAEAPKDVKLPKAKN